jgi:ribonuclease E
MARLGEDGRQLLDAADLDRYITGNYGEDQFSCSDDDDSDDDLDEEDDDDDLGDDDDFDLDEEVDD